MREGDRSPWGKIQHVTVLAPGAWSVSTAGHGGIKLDAARNRKVPALVRGERGWYEEDCDWAIPAFVHKDVGDVLLARARKADPEKFGESYIAECLQRWQTEEELKALGLGKN